MMVHQPFGALLMLTRHIFYLTHYVFTVFRKYTEYRIVLKIVKYDLKMHKKYDHDKIQ